MLAVARATAAPRASMRRIPAARCGAPDPFLPSEAAVQEPQEFHYRLPARFGGARPGAHRGASLGSGQAFAGHRRLLDQPDPRRLDLRASLRDPRGDWLVRIQRQRVAVPVHAIVDVSASMRFGTLRSKLEVAADFVESLGHSAFRAGDALGLLAFDEDEREDLMRPARHGRGLGRALAAALRASAPRPAPAPAWRRAWRPAAPPSATPPAARRPGVPAAPGALDALRRCARRLAGRPGLVFLVSDFHWPLDGLLEALDDLAPSVVLPMIAWDPAEIEPPAAGTLLALRDAESGARRTVWTGGALPERWRSAVAARRAELRALFDARGLAPFELCGRAGGFDAEALTRHFMEAVA